MKAIPERPVPNSPGFIIAELDRSARLLEEMANQPIVEIDVQRSMLPFAWHQNSSSISEVRNFERGAI